MTERVDELSHALRLRREFDQAFAVDAREVVSEFEDFLRLRIEGRLYAFRLAELASLQAGLPVVGAQSAAPEFLGIAGLRGALVPVYDLHALLGHSPARGPRWLAITRGKDQVGLAFEEFDGHLRRERGSGQVASDGQDGGAPAGLETPEGLALVISVSSICGVIQQRVRNSHPSER